MHDTIHYAFTPNPTLIHIPDQKHSHRLCAPHLPLHITLYLYKSFRYTISPRRRPALRPNFGFLSQIAAS
jgi:hypothetical protein